MCQKISRFSTRPTVPRHSHPSIESKLNDATPAFSVHSATESCSRSYKKPQPLKPRVKTIVGLFPIAFFESLHSATALPFGGISPLTPTKPEGKSDKANARSAVWLTTRIRRPAPALTSSMVPESKRLWIFRRSVADILLAGTEEFSRRVLKCLAKELTNPGSIFCPLPVDFYQSARIKNKPTAVVLKKIKVFCRIHRLRTGKNRGEA